MDSPERDALDALDLRLLRALQIDARASFSRIGAALGVSDRTVARRFKRLCDLANLRVVGVTDDRGPGGVSSWIVRLGCAPDVAERLADTLARRPDTVYVAVASGGTEVVCGVRDGDGLVLDRLQRSAEISSISAHRLLRSFHQGPLGRVHRIDALTPDQEAALRPAPAEPSGGTIPRSAADDVLLAALRRDGRTPLTELGQVTGQSESTVRRRLERLRSTGVLQYAVQFDHEHFDHGFRVLLWLTVAPAHLTRVGLELVGHREVSFAAAVTGDSNVVVSTYFATRTERYAYLISGLRDIEGIGRVETASVLRQVKQLAHP
ncbi:AsnC family transcriptional regulator [Streptomyces geranii]|uniref:AsnC family transcriptional regulator n=1 Tax=Streptomyces geranii TaxID=2058923 RepID=UPI001E37A1C1|nr:AsnC family transcriptional regulator [Streptomyces geranii]